MYLDSSGLGQDLLEIGTVFSYRNRNHPSYFELKKSIYGVSQLSKVWECEVRWGAPQPPCTSHP